MHQILSFLEELEAHNTTERMHTHQPAYKAAKEKLLAVSQICIDKINTFDATIGELYPPETVFRLAKDTRFSKDKSPYKTNMGIVIAPGGKKSIFPCYYIHLQPGNRSFLAGGLYHPEQPIQIAIRDHLITHRSSLQDILKNSAFRKMRGNVHGDAYKKIPRGYPLDHPAGDFFKQKDRLVERPLSDDEINAKDFLEKTIAQFRILTPFNNRLHEAIMSMLKNQ